MSPVTGGCNMYLQVNSMHPNPPIRRAAAHTYHVGSIVSPSGGTNYTLGDDKFTPALSLGFDFNLYDCFIANQVWVGSNGHLCFSADGQQPNPGNTYSPCDYSPDN